MNNPNPLIPQGSLSGQPKGKSNFRIAVFTILIIHVVLICGFLIQGCKKDPVQSEVNNVEPTNTPPDDFQPFGTETTQPFPNDPNAIPPYGTQPTGGVTGAAPVTSSFPTPSDPTLTSSVAPVIIDPVIVPPVGETKVHVIAKGDTLSDIATKYRVSLKAIEEANPGINPLRLQLGQKINIPASTATATSSPAIENGNGDFIIYTVKAGDALERIANNHNTTVQAIKAANGLRTDRINVGQKLKIPKK